MYHYLFTLAFGNNILTYLLRKKRDGAIYSNKICNIVMVEWDAIKLK